MDSGTGFAAQLEEQRFQFESRSAEQVEAVTEQLHARIVVHMQDVKSQVADIEAQGDLMSGALILPAALEGAAGRVS